MAKCIKLVSSNFLQLHSISLLQILLISYLKNWQWFYPVALSPVFTIFHMNIRINFLKHKYSHASKILDHPKNKVSNLTRNSRSFLTKLGAASPLSSPVMLNLLIFQNFNLLLLEIHPYISPSKYMKHLLNCRAQKLAR